MKFLIKTVLLTTIFFYTLYPKTNSVIQVEGKIMINDVYSLNINISNNDKLDYYFDVSFWKIMGYTKNKNPIHCMPVPDDYGNPYVVNWILYYPKDKDKRKGYAGHFEGTVKDNYFPSILEIKSMQKKNLCITLPKEFQNILQNNDLEIVIRLWYNSKKEIKAFSEKILDKEVIKKDSIRINLNTLNCETRYFDKSIYSCEYKDKLDELKHELTKKSIGVIIDWIK